MLVYVKNFPGSFVKTWEKFVLALFRLRDIVSEMKRAQIKRQIFFLYIEIWIFLPLCDF